MGVNGTLNRGGGMLTKRQELVNICGYFEPNGTSSPTVVKMPGVKSVSRTAAGAWTVTLDDSYYEVVSVQASLQLHAISDVKLVVSDTTAAAQSTAATIKLLAYTNNNAGAYEAPTAADIANVAGASGNRVHLNVVMARRST